MKVKEVSLNANGYPERLTEVATPPAQLFILGDAFETLLSRPCVAIVGSRKVTPYGRAITARLAMELAREGVVIISGLAIGVDVIAHRAALDAGGLTIAVLPGGLDHIYPASHRQLAADILEQGGALVSEYPSGTTLYRGNFTARNRIVSGLSDGVLITEAAEKSGTLHTARFALEQGRDVMAVPGNITSPTSAGTNNLIKSGAAPITDVSDVFNILGIAPQKRSAKARRGANAAEQCLLDLIAQGTPDGSALLKASRLETALFNQTLTMLEISGKIRPLGSNQWAVVY